MAAPGTPLVPRPSLVAVLVPGDGRYRFCSTLIALEPGDWVAVAGPFGQEPGQVVRGSGSVLAGTEREQSPVIDRRLDPGEISSVAHRARRALEQTSAAVRIAAEAAPEVQVSGLRYTLSGEVICSCVVPEGCVTSELLDQLSRLLDVATHLEPVQGSARFGGLGKDSGLPADPAERAFDERLSRVGAWPHLGDRVRGAGVEGQLQGISVRDGDARIRDTDGQEHVVPVDQLEG